jgi:cell wall assembly regulator SMI1
MDLQSEVKKDWKKLFKWGKKEYKAVKESNLKGHYLNQITAIKAAMGRKEKLPSEIKGNKSLTKKDKSMLLDKLKFV